MIVQILGQRIALGLPIFNFEDFLRGVFMEFRSFFKKAIAIGLSVFTLTSFQAQKSQALVGGVIASPVVLLIGLTAFVGGGIGALVIDPQCPGKDMWDYPKCENEASTFVITAIAGITILDDSTMTVTFSQLSSDQSNTLGVSESDRTTFNQNIDEMNAVFSSIQADIANSGLTDSTQLANLSKQLWTAQAQSVDPVSYSVAQKIATFALK